jgi:predicted membrane channel-forming protein YqfA (hemolysin III family)
MSVTDAPGAESRPLLFDTARGLYYPKPALRGWRHLLWFEASLVLAPLALIDVRGPTQTTAVAIYTATVSDLSGVSALYHRGHRHGRAGSVDPRRSGPPAAGRGVLYTVGALCYHRRRPDPAPAIFGYHAVFHTYACVAAACQYIAMTLLLV